MLELYMRLFEARSVNFVATGSGSGIGRDEVLGAAALATNKHPLGNRVVLAEMGDQHSITAMAEWAKTILPELYESVVAVALGRPLPEQLNKLICAHPRYDRERRRAAVMKSKANHLAKTGNPDEANKLEEQAAGVISLAREHCKEEILSKGRCPKCHGTGKMERKECGCQVCNGTGKTIPDIREIHKKYGSEIFKQFTHLTDVMQIERQEWINEFMRQIQREKAA